MCGIAGFTNLNNINPQKIQKSLKHRGPDASRIYQDKYLTLVHTRLAIQDLSERAAQPMHYGDYVIILNGEIYNHKALRNELAEFNFISDSDTETLLYLFIKYGKDCLHKMDGMFALAIYNKKEKELFLARDRAGKKPLYYYFDGSLFFFASELRTISQQIPLQIKHENINAFLQLGFFYKDATPFEKVYELPAGSYLTLQLNGMVYNQTKWWDIRPFYESGSSLSFQEALEHLDYKLNESVRRRLESSDLEVGTFLSSGIDSGIISAMAAGFRPHLKAFTISFANQYDETPMAGLIAEKYQLEQVRININFDHLTNDLAKILGNYGEPFFDSSAIPSYYVSQEAKKYMTVILNGDGGDELFGGYRRYVPFAKFDFFKNKTFRKSAAFLHSLLPLPKEKMNGYNYLYRLISFSRKSNPLQIYLSATTDIFEDFNNSFIDPDSGLDSIRSDLKDTMELPLSSLKKIMLMDFQAILPGALLVKMDIATMAHSLEGRSPLLAKEILEFAPTLPDSFKIRNRQTKFILRELAKKYLPEPIIHLPKRGFEIPLKDWVNHQLKPIIYDYLLNPAFVNLLFKPVFIDSLLNNNIKTNPEKRAKMLWALFVLEIWYKSFHPHD